MWLPLPRIIELGMRDLGGPRRAPALPSLPSDPRGLALLPSYFPLAIGLILTQFLKEKEAFPASSLCT